jgi:hypothetical protein
MSANPRAAFDPLPDREDEAMSKHQLDQVCAKVVEKMSSRQHLDAAEKEHLGECEICMAEILRRFDEAAKEAAKSPGSNGASNHDDLDRSRPEALRALEHGRRVFAREFGITL